MTAVLDPFSEETDMKGGAELVMVYQVEWFMGLNAHLLKTEDVSKPCQPLVTTLSSSLVKRFFGIKQT